MTQSTTERRCCAHISIHIPRVGDDGLGHEKRSTMDISIHIPRVGDDGQGRRHQADRGISIHIPRVGDDKYPPAPPFWTFISIHIPRVGDDRRFTCPTGGQGLFQSTSPVWGMTAKVYKKEGSVLYFCAKNFCFLGNRPGFLRGGVGRGLGFLGEAGAKVPGDLWVLPLRTEGQRIRGSAGS